MKFWGLALFLIVVFTPKAICMRIPRAIAVATPVPTLGNKQIVGTYTFQGCYTEATNMRALSSASFYDYPAMTIEECAADCAGYAYFGVEYGGECYCGNILNPGSVLASITDCSFICPGNQYEYCGAGLRLNLYELIQVASIATTIRSTSSTMSSRSGISSTSSILPSLRAIITSTISTILTTSTTPKTVSPTSSSLRGSTTLTTSIISTTSIAPSFTLITSTISSTSTTSTTLASPPPAGPQTVTALAGYNYLGCYTEATTGRALNGILLPIAAGNTDVENCAAACSAYTYFGVEYGQECYCGNVLNAGSVNSNTVANANPCNIVCADNANEYCGGRSVLNLYQVAVVVSSSISSSSTLSSTSMKPFSSTTSTVSSLPSISSKPISSSFITSSTSTKLSSNSITSSSAALSASPLSTSGSVGTGKRGLAYTDGNPDGNAEYANFFVGYPKISWGYDWGYPSQGLDSYFEFVPMLWGLPSGSDPSWTAAVSTAKNILGFNEPDLTYSGSSNILPAAAAAGYALYMEPFAGSVKIGMPNVLWNNVGPTSGGNYDSAVWMQYFLGNCTSCHFDFAAIHLYLDCDPSDGQSGAAWFQGNVTNAYEILKLPVWITEFQCYGTDAQQIAFLQQVLPWLDAQSYVQRYAYFGTFPSHTINADGTGLSKIGIAYATT